MTAAAGLRTEIGSAAVHPVHATERGARARAIELDGFDAHVEQRRIED